MKTVQYKFLIIIIIIIIIIINNAVCINIFCAKGVVSYCVNLSYFVFRLQMSGPIKEESGRVRHYKGVGEQVQQETSLGKSS